MDTAPRSYYVSPLLTVDVDTDSTMSFMNAMVSMRHGHHVTVKSADMAKDLLQAFGSSPQQAADSIRFGQTGRF